MLRRFQAPSLVVIVLASFLCLAQVQDGKLQIHFMDVGQGDGAVLVSPKGEVVLFDDGALHNCDKPIAYLQQLGVTEIQYHIASHYHADHIGCAKDVLSQFPLKKTAFDRGGSYPGGHFDRYVEITGTRRQTATTATKIILDPGVDPVEIDIVALNGHGVVTTNENDLSLVAVVHYGNFKAEIGGDLSGYKTSNYEDIETGVAPLVGPVQVYKVHHHCSAYSTNDQWLATIRPQVGIVSVGDSNTFGHPTLDCLERLHHAGVLTYWTERGNGETADPGLDTVAGTVVVRVAPGANTFTVTMQNGVTQMFAFGGAVPPPPATSPAFVWSKRSNVYHRATCRYVQSISAENRASGDSPPQGKTLHEGCPK